MVIYCVELPFKHYTKEKRERKIEGKGGLGRRCKQLLEDIKEKRGYGKLKEEVLYHILCRNRCSRSYGSVLRQTT